MGLLQRRSLQRRSLQLFYQCRYVHMRTDVWPRVGKNNSGRGAAWRYRHHQHRHASNGGNGGNGGGNGDGKSGSDSDSSKAEPIDIPATLWYQRLGPVTQFFGWFHRTQGRRPLTVQLCTSLLTYLCGDLLAQEIGGEGYDPWRTLRMLTIGSISSIPGYKWFLWLGNNFNYSSRWGSILVKTCVQQAIFTPVFNSYFFGMQAILTGESPSGVIERIKAAVPVSMWNSLKLWPAVTAFSFAFIQPTYRFMFSGIFAVCWQAYLSFLNRAEEKLERAGNNVARKLKEINEPRTQGKQP